MDKSNTTTLKRSIQRNMLGVFHSSVSHKILKHKQVSLTSALEEKYNKSRKQWKEETKVVTLYLVKDILLLKAVDDLGFRTLTHT